jgi:hypothetical protein
MFPTREQQNITSSASTTAESTAEASSAKREAHANPCRCRIQTNSCSGIVIFSGWKVCWYLSM